MGGRLFGSLILVTGFHVLSAGVPGWLLKQCIQKNVSRKPRKKSIKFHVFLEKTVFVYKAQQILISVAVVRNSNSTVEVSAIMVTLQCS